MLFEFITLVFATAFCCWYWIYQGKQNQNQSIRTQTSTRSAQTTRSSNFTDTDNVQTARSMRDFSICSTSSLAPLESKHDRLISPINVNTPCSETDSRSTKNTLAKSPSDSQQNTLNGKSEQWPVSTVIKDSKENNKQKEQAYSTSQWPGATRKF
ncbi:unnamed protein product [Caenorhabditis angaria]|uniref:Uncharacterized protein n=1 Tax=Caenorhabditis angaria TaxID=860376 RepID=A0A9P1I4M9_9PELO|nr:unnamed protein product [Caenorhabditis angaria]